MKTEIKKSLERLIELQWITINKHVQLDAVAMLIESDLELAKQNEQKRQELQTLLNLLDKHYPDKIEAVFGKPKVMPDTQRKQ